MRAEGEGVDELRARAASALSAGDVERARTCLQQLVFLRPHDVAAHYMMGMALAQSGRDAQARRKFEVAAELLEGTDDGEPVPGTEGLPAGYLRASLRTLLAKGQAR
jgi:Flp pilus assembly protein TadD